MVKIVWLLKKADHLTDEEFKGWWLESLSTESGTSISMPG